MSGGTPTTRIVFDGQSLNTIPAAAGQAYPHQTMRGRSEAYTVVAISGTSWTVLATTAATRLHPLGPLATTSVLVMNGGTSDLTEDDSGATIMADAVSYADAARTAGFDYVIVTTIPPAVHLTGARETARDDFNTLVVADAGGDFDAVVDFRGTVLNDYSDADYYIFDQIHWGVGGAKVAADLVAAAIDSVLS